MKNDPFPITASNINDLWKKYKDKKSKYGKNKLKNKLVLYYFNSLVKKIAYKLAEKLNWHVPPDELASYGVDGLYNAIDKYELERNIKFECYAAIRIWGSMLDEIRKIDPIPRSVRINHGKIQRAKEQIQAEEKREVTDSEIVEKIGINEKDYHSNLKKYMPLSYLSIQGGDKNQEGEVFKQDFNSGLIDKKTLQPDKELKKSEFLSKLLGSGISEIEKTVIYCYYYKNLSMQEISREYKLSEARISKIHKKALPKLKKKIEKNPKYFSDLIPNFNEK